jgi:hypothetical protein
VITEQCREAFEALVKKMRFFHGHYFLIPPLTNADIVSLGLTPKDDKPTRSGKPTAEVKADLSLAGGKHELAMRIVYLSGNPEDRANKGYRVWYKTVPPGGEAPTDPEELPKSFYTRRRKDVAHFEYGDSGKTVYNGRAGGERRHQGRLGAHGKRAYSMRITIKTTNKRRQQ